MADHDTYEDGVTDGDTMSDGWFNGVVEYIEYARPTPSVIYTDVGFDSSQTGAGSDADDHVLEVGGGEIADFVVIEVLCKTIMDADTAATSVSLKIETAEHGGGYTSRFDHNLSAGTSTENSVTETKSIRFYYAPTSDEKTNGLDIKLTSTSVCADADTCSFTNIQTIIWTH